MYTTFDVLTPGQIATVDCQKAMAVLINGAVYHAAMNAGEDEPRDLPGLNVASVTVITCESRDAILKLLTDNNHDAPLDYSNLNIFNPEPGQIIDLTAAPEDGVVFCDCPEVLGDLSALCLRDAILVVQTPDWPHTHSDLEPDVVFDSETDDGMFSIFTRKMIVHCQDAA